MLGARVRVTVGTDGAISGNDLDLWMALRLAATLHRAATLDATAVTTAQALRMATIEGAAALGAADRIGSLEPGQDGRHDPPSTSGAPTPRRSSTRRTHLLFSTAKSDVRHVFVGGRQVVRDGVADPRGPRRTTRRSRGSHPRIVASVRDRFGNTRRDGVDHDSSTRRTGRARNRMQAPALGTDRRRKRDCPRFRQSTPGPWCPPRPILFAGDAGLGSVRTASPA